MVFVPRICIHRNVDNRTENRIRRDIFLLKHIFWMDNQFNRWMTITSRKRLISILSFISFFTSCDYISGGGGGSESLSINNFMTKSHFYSEKEIRESTIDSIGTLFEFSVCESARKHISPEYFVYATKMIRRWKSCDYMRNAAPTVRDVARKSWRRSSRIRFRGMPWLCATNTRPRVTAHGTFVLPSHTFAERFLIRKTSWVIGSTRRGQLLS